MKISFLGDIICHTAVLEGSKNNDDYDFTDLYKHVIPLLQDSDYIVANIECAVRLTDQINFEGDRTLRYTKHTQELYPYVTIPNTNKKFILISAPVDFVTNTISTLGINQVLMANNHALDNGAECFNLAKQLYTNAGCDINGLYGQCGVIKEINGKKIGFYNYTNIIKSVPNDDSQRMIQYHYNKAELQRLRSEVDYLIVLPHWGTEYSRSFSNQQQMSLIDFGEVGVDKIIGTHQHIVSEWGLGDFLSGRIEPRSRMGVICHLAIDENTGNITTSYDYVWSTFRGTLYDSVSVVPVQDVLDGKIELPAEEKNTMKLIYNEYKF